MFGDVVNRKLASEDYRNIDLRKSKNLHFSKKIRSFFKFVFSQNRVRNFDVEVVGRKLPFLVYKKMTKYGPKKCLRTL